MAGDPILSELQTTQPQAVESFLAETRTAVFDVNEETKIANIVESTENPYYEGL